MFKLGIDVGGTFTDFVIADPDGRTLCYKSPTTSAQPAQGVFNGLEKIARDKGLNLKELLASTEIIVHGTTITTNSLLSGQLAKTGFISTKGFRDILNLRRGIKERQYDPKCSPPSPLVPRHLIWPVEERINVEGKVLTPLNSNEVRQALNYFKREKVEALAVGFLWAFLNPVHEREAAEICRQEMAEAYLSLSSQVLPQIRVYERFSTTVLNSCLGPRLATYLESLEQGLAQEGFQGSLLIMQSNGGVMSPKVAARYAVNTLHSGPAASPVAGLAYASLAGDYPNLIVVDVGGTSFDVTLVQDGQVSITTESQVGGYQIGCPRVDIHSIGAGGGSIAWVDQGGILRVGPASAGAEPGPACYGQGGAHATVTDADLLLGYINPDFFCHGEIALDRAKAVSAIRAQVAEVLGVGVEAAAHGIFSFANALMANAIRIMTLQRGLDPREFVLVVAGGAGPVHAASLAKELGIPLIIVPKEGSVFCAMGMLLTDLKHDYVRTFTGGLDKLDTTILNNLCEEMKQEGTTTLSSEGVPLDRIRLEPAADCRYQGQFNEVCVPLPRGPSLDDEALKKTAELFHARHLSLYGYCLANSPVELINMRLTAIGLTPKPVMEKVPRAGSDPGAAYKGSRPAFFEEQFVSTPIYDGMKLLAGNVVNGPAIVEQPTTCIVVPGDYRLECDNYGNYLIYLR